LCADSVASLLALAERPEEVEFVLRRDIDDTTSYPAISQSTCVVGPPLSYTGLHTYYNECAAASRGTWLVVWNDDCEMRTHGWDARLRALDPAILLAVLHGYFPTVSRQWFETLGHVTQSAHADSYLVHVGDVLSKTSSWRWPDVGEGPWDVDHKNVVDDGAERRNRDVGGPEGTSAKFFSAAMRAEIVRDAEKLRTLIEGRQHPLGG
jgi:hypothetical protein